jgi:predicted porin
MNKNLIALAVSTAFALPAMADVAVGPFSIYGTAQSAIENVSISFLPTATTKSTTDTSKTSQSRLMDQTSKLGFKIAHDLGAGMTGLAQVESRFYLGNGGNNTQDKAEVGSRSTFVGLGSSEFGTVRLGRYDNAYKLSLKAAAPFLYNNVNDASAEYGDKQILNRLGARQGDMVAYESPKIQGFQALVSYNMGKDSDNGLGAASFAANTGATAAADAVKQNAVSIFPATLMPQTAVSLAYAQGPFTVAYGYTSISNAAWQLDSNSSTSAAYNTTAGASFGLSAYQFGGQYTFGEYSLGGSYEVTSSSQKGVSSTKDFDQSQATYAWTGAYKSGPHEAHFRYAVAADVEGKTGIINNTLKTDTGATQYSLMYAYEFNKSVKFVSSYTNVANKANAKFTSASGFAVDTGASMSQIAIGLAATF